MTDPQRIEEHMVLSHQGTHPALIPPPHGIQPVQHYLADPVDGPPAVIRAFDIILDLGHERPRGGMDPCVAHTERKLRDLAMMHVPDLASLLDAPKEIITPLGTDEDAVTVRRGRRVG